MARHRRQAFTLIELLVVITIVAVLIGLLVPALGAARKFARKAKDSTQIRSIVQGLTVWGGNHDGEFPRPSSLDLGDTTVATGSGEAPLVKDNTGNVLSVLIFNALLETEQTKSTAETSTLIEIDEGFERDSVSRAEVPERALWDPGFAGFAGEKNSFSGVGSKGRRSETVGNNSYALAMPFGDRAEQWSLGASATTVLAGNRGPRYIGEPGDWQLRPNQQGVGSKTLGFYGPEDVWHGHLAFGDGRVGFVTQPDPSDLKLSFPNGVDGSFGDNVFANENDNTGEVRPDDEDHPGRWKNAFIRPYGNVQAAAGQAGDPRVALFFD